MGEIIAMTAEIEEFLAANSNAVMSKEDYEAQKRSFVIGNAFDVYADGDTINEDKIETLATRRLTISL